ncbi:leucine-rich repeat domain-containing protein [Thermohalobacter berrensis]|uniref:Copper amine oxidase-like N-terminal domain-containing protein n=1 Tax=Thermohalobacter berrensis TaxID=99594 RepID=A0A419T473_9FIRM|nr:leucine-rich repeat domain-containing protein [Thermohalobacter berrensis]RKD32245.1 hypothetical protein BET03_02735 [Thermohalobacter berrensis]
MKRLSVLLTLIMVLVSLKPAMSYAEEQPIKVVVNGELIEFDVQPTMVNGRVLVPIRAIFEKLGLEVGWDAKTQTAIGTKDGITIKLPIGKKIAIRNGQPIELDTPAMVVNGRTLVPVRFIAESLGADVSWDSSTWTAIIEYQLSPEELIKRLDVSEDLKVLKLALVKMFDADTLTMDIDLETDVKKLTGDRVSVDMTMKTTGYMGKYDDHETSITNYEVEKKDGRKEIDFEFDVLQVNDEVTVKLDYERESVLETLNLNVGENVAKLNEYKQLGVDSYNITTRSLNSIYQYGQIFNDDNMQVEKLDNGDIKYTLELNKEDIQAKYMNNPLLATLLHYNEIDFSLIYIIDEDGNVKYVKSINENNNDPEDALLNVKSIEIEQEIEISYDGSQDNINKDIVEFNKKNTAKIFPDPWLEKAVRKAIEKPFGEITESDLEGITNFGADIRDIYDIEGIQYMENLETLNLSFNQISDLEPLEDLENLKLLYLHGNKIENIEPLSKLKNLEILSLDWNQIEDIEPLENLTNLKDLSISDNKIEDITPLKKLVNLKKLRISSNKIKDISPLSYLTNLEDLVIYRNQIEDISPLSKLTNLKYLLISNNKIKDVTPLSNLTNLRELYIYSNEVEDVSPLTNLENLKALSIYDNNIKDFTPLDKFKNINLKLHKEDEE